jgi:hypothetical protein
LEEMERARNRMQELYDQKAEDWARKQQELEEKRCIFFTVIGNQFCGSGRFIPDLDPTIFCYPGPGSDRL